jgi:hypothetical protein
MDKFNDIWKNSFNDGDMPVGDWNTPDQVVWDNILPHVATQKADRKWLLLLFGTMLMGLMFLGYFTFIKVDQGLIAAVDFSNPIIEPSPIPASNDVKKEDKGQNNIKTLPTKEQGNTNAASSLSNRLNQNIKVRKSESAPGSMKKKISIDKENKTRAKKTATNNILPITEGLSKEWADKSNADNRKKEEENYLNSEEVNIYESAYLAELPFLPGREPSYLQINKLEVLPKEVKIKLLENQKPKRAAFGIRSGVVFLQHKISANYQSDLAPFDFNYTNNTGWFSALDAQVSLNKFLDISGSIQYESEETSSGHNSDLSYSVSDEENANSNEYTVDLATPYGLSEAKFRFDRNEDIGIDGVNLLVDFHSQHTLRNLSIPIGVKIYPMGKRQRYIPFAKIGFGTNYLFNISNSIQSINTHHDAIQYKRDGSSIFQSPNLNNWHFDLRLGLGFGYYITNKFQLNLSYDWSRGLNPVFEQGNYKTSLDRHYLSMGVLKSF